MRKGMIFVVVFILLASLMNNVGACTFDGSDQITDFLDCQKETEKAYPNSEYYLAKMYQIGHGVDINNKKSFSLYMSSAKKGENKEVKFSNAMATESQYELGLIFSERKDLEKAAYWLEQAARRYHTQAQYLIATLYAHGESAPQNFEKAVYWATKSAESGFTYAQALLANYYKHGVVAELDLSKSIYWLKKAANNNHSESQYLLGLALALGEGTPKSIENSFVWYKRSAENGNVKALTVLSLIYDSGRSDLKRDPVKAYAYANLAVALGDEMGKPYRDSLLEKLSKAQIIESQQLAASILLEIRQRK